MYRFRTIAEVKYGHFKEYWEISKKLNELARERGWTELTLSRRWARKRGDR